MKDKVIRIATFVLVLLCLGVIIGFYYGMRFAMVELSRKVQVDSSSFYLYRGPQLIAYSIFFIVNTILYGIIMHPLAQWVTKYENWPTQSAYNTSVNMKLYLFSIGVELIGPIDLTFVQLSLKTECYSSWCYRELEAYIYTRYLVMMGYVLLSAVVMFFKYFQSRQMNLKAFKKLFNDEDNEISEISFGLKYSRFLAFVQR